MSKPLAATSVRAHARIYPDDLTSAIQETLAILADLAFAHEAACERLALWDGPEPGKAEIAADLEARHEAARAPYARRLEALRQRVRDVSVLAPLH
jgi:hypothetical protein